MVSGTHTIPIRIPKDMGMIWQAYHKGVPCPWGSLESPLIWIFQRFHIYPVIRVARDDGAFPTK